MRTTKPSRPPDSGTLSDSVLARKPPSQRGAKCVTWERVAGQSVPDVWVRGRLRARSSLSRYGRLHGGTTHSHPVEDGGCAHPTDPQELAVAEVDNGGACLRRQVFVRAGAQRSVELLRLLEAQRLGGRDVVVGGCGLVSGLDDNHVLVHGISLSPMYCFVYSAMKTEPAGSSSSRKAPPRPRVCSFRKPNLLRGTYCCNPSGGPVAGVYGGVEPTFHMGIRLLGTLPGLRGSGMVVRLEEPRERQACGTRWRTGRSMVGSRPHGS